MALAIGRGKRAFIAGKTGSGKTRAALFLLHHMRDYPVYIFDTKIEPAFKQILGPLAEIVDGIAGYDPQKAKKPFVILRPSAQEATDPQFIDSIVFRVHDSVEGCTIYIDEAYQLHLHGRAGPGIIGALTRGRSRDQTVILSSQRPAWISGFCMTEADKFFIFRLGDLKDRKRLREFIPDDSILDVPPKYHFWHYDVQDDDATLYKPFPLSIGSDTQADLAKLIDGAPISQRLKRKSLTLL